MGLANDAQPPSDGVVIHIDESLFMNSRLAPGSAAETGKARALPDYCSTGRGKVIHDTKIAGATFAWSEERRGGMKWNHILLVVRMDDPSIPKTFGMERSQAFEFLWNPEVAATMTVLARLGCRA